MELKIKNYESSFKDLICFKSEITNPQEMKKNIDKLVNLLNKMKIYHKNEVISKVIDKNSIKKTVTIQIYIPIQKSKNIDAFFYKYPAYKYQKEFIIKRGYWISISNNMEEFKKAVGLFISKMNNEESINVQNYDVSNNSIIEVSRIGYDGAVLGFDLYMEVNEL